MKAEHIPSYINLSNAVFRSKIDGLYDLTEGCELCPRKCGAKRFKGEKGLCGAAGILKIASMNLHFGEEPSISGKNGSGTVFFSGCSLKCKFCQNYPVSRYCTGKIYDASGLAEGMLKLQEKGANNINLVTSLHYMFFVAEAIFLAKNKGLKIPIVYNSSGYEEEKLLYLLDGIIDIYLPDIKYSDDKYALQYSGVADYVIVNRRALKIMYDQVGELKVNNCGIAVSGLLARHLVLPNGISGYADSFRFIAEEIDGKVPISLMSQYFPAYKAFYDININRKITESEYLCALKEITEDNLTGFFQNDRNLYI
ncbi:radical SAM protein [Candidatus Acidulodesulfobacterium sp. H_13]|uniref:radical SAM protein n=1 Tax=Candidatus Acidulodesulfobacterium sp. H_13 TaxID=3395470 RepID=UPI003AF6FF8D